MAAADAGAEKETEPPCKDVKPAPSTADPEHPGPFEYANYKYPYEAIFDDAARANEILIAALPMNAAYTRMVSGLKRANVLRHETILLGHHEGLWPNYPATFRYEYHSTLQNGYLLYKPIYVSDSAPSFVVFREVGTIVLTLKHG